MLAKIEEYITESPEGKKGMHPTYRSTVYGKTKVEGGLYL